MAKEGIPISGEPIEIAIGIDIEIEEEWQWPCSRAFYEFVGNAAFYEMIKA